MRLAAVEADYERPAVELGMTGYQNVLAGMRFWRGVDHSWIGADDQAYADILLGDHISGRLVFEINSHRGHSRTQAN